MDETAPAREATGCRNAVSVGTSGSNVGEAPFRSAVPTAFLVAAASAYGANIPFARLASFAGVSGADLVALRVALLLVVLAAAAVLSQTSVRVPRGERSTLFGLGLTTALVGLAYVSSVSFIPVGIAVLVFYTYPLLILLASPFVDGGGLTLNRLIAFALAFAGIALAIGPSFQALDWRGIALAAAASIAAATQFFFASRAPGGGGIVTVFWVHVVILPVALLASLVSGGPASASTFIGAFWPVAIMSTLYFGGFVAQLRGMRQTSAAAAGLIFCLEPIVATIAAALMLGERLSLTQYGGGALVLAGIVTSLASRPVRRIREPTPVLMDAVCVERRPLS
ncbi:MAG: DMT family transporter [Methylobacteriaceae bacterium]|nr:DMT family transporter [Methylobacteriaceae bacterium]